MLKYSRLVLKGFTMSTKTATKPVAQTKEAGWFTTIFGQAKVIAPEAGKAVVTGLKVANVNLDTALNLSIAGNFTSKEVVLDSYADYKDALTSRGISYEEAEAALAAMKG